MGALTDNDIERVQAQIETIGLGALAARAATPPGHIWRSLKGIAIGESPEARIVATLDLLEIEVTP